MTQPAPGGPALSDRVRRMTAVLLLAACGTAAASPGQEPLGVRTPGSLRDLFLDVVQWDARAVTALRLDVGWAVANDWSTPTTLTRDGQVVQVRLDEQADSLTAAIRVPWGVVLGSPEGSFLRRLATAVEVRGTVHWGGWSDPVIDAWHRVFAYNDFARPAFPANEIHLALHPAFGTGPVDHRPGHLRLRRRGAAQPAAPLGGRGAAPGGAGGAGRGLPATRREDPHRVAPAHGRLGGMGPGARPARHLAGHLLAGRARHRHRIALVAHGGRPAAAAAHLAGQRRALAGGPPGRVVAPAGGPLGHSPPSRPAGGSSR